MGLGRSPVRSYFIKLPPLPLHHFSPFSPAKRLKRFTGCVPIQIP